MLHIYSVTKMNEKTFSVSDILLNLDIEFFYLHKNSAIDLIEWEFVITDMYCRRMSSVSRASRINPWLQIVY